MGHDENPGSDPRGLVCFAAPDGGAGWVNPTSGSCLRLEPNGIYRVSRHVDGFDQVVILAQAAPTEAARLIGAPNSVASHEYAWELIEIVDEMEQLSAPFGRRGA